jgi:hypothetical protein
MANSPRNPDTDDDTGVEPDRGATTGSSRWQKVVGIIGLVVLLVLGIRMFVVGGGHGAGQDAPGVNQEQEDGGGHVPPPWVPDH